LRKKIFGPWHKKVGNHWCTHFVYAARNDLNHWSSFSAQYKQHLVRDTSVYDSLYFSKERLRMFYWNPFLDFLIIIIFWLADRVDILFLTLWEKNDVNEKCALPGICLIEIKTSVRELIGHVIDIYFKYIYKYTYIHTYVRIHTDVLIHS